MKALKVFVIILLATFSYQAVNAQTVHRKRHPVHHKKHHHVKRHHVVRHK